MIQLLSKSLLLDHRRCKQKEYGPVNIVAYVLVIASHLFDNQCDKLTSMLLKILLALTLETQVHHHGNQELQSEVRNMLSLFSKHSKYHRNDS